MINVKPKAVIRDWFFMGFSDRNILHREDIKDKKVCLYGRTYKNEDYDSYTGEFSDGHRVITSPVVEIDWGTFLVKTTSGSVYLLEGPEGSMEDFYGEAEDEY